MSIDNPSIVECEEDIHWIYENGSSPQPIITCGYCGEVAKRRNVHAAIRWFHEHEYGRQAARGYEWEAPSESLDV